MIHTITKIIIAIFAIVILRGIYFVFSIYTTEMTRISRRRAKRKAHTHMMKKARKQQRVSRKLQQRVSRKLQQRTKSNKVATPNGCKNPKMAIKRSYVVSPIIGI